MSDPQGRNFLISIKSNFREGLLTEYVISCKFQRTCRWYRNKMANSGYLTRRLVGVSASLLCEFDL
jgi:DNA-directed RNA polymerase beta' subunit